MIKLENVTKTYGVGDATRDVLSGINLHVAKGEFLAIVGSSGSGKTTLLNIMGGLDRPTGGRVVADGIDLVTLDDASLSRFRNETMGFIFQHFNLLEHMSCLDNVILPGFFKSSGVELRTGAEGSVRVQTQAQGQSQSQTQTNGQSKAKAKALMLLEQMGIGRFAHEKPGRMSGGQKQRVAIARSLFCSPRLLLCDEPTGNLDTATGGQIFDHITRLNKEFAMTVVVVTHQHYLAERADRIISIEDGRIYSGGEP